MLFLELHAHLRSCCTTWENVNTTKSHGGEFRSVRRLGQLAPTSPPNQSGVSSLLPQAPSPSPPHWIPPAVPNIPSSPSICPSASGRRVLQQACTQGRTNLPGHGCPKRATGGDQGHVRWLKEVSAENLGPNSQRSTECMQMVAPKAFTSRVWFYLWGKQKTELNNPLHPRQTLVSYCRMWEGLE